MYNCKTGGRQLRFYNSNGITTCDISITVRNKLWYINQDATSTIYRAKIGQSSDAFVRSIIGSTLHHLWHHMLNHPGQLATDNVNMVVDRVPSLRTRNPFFSCNDCTRGKFTQTLTLTRMQKNPYKVTQQEGGGEIPHGLQFCPRKNYIYK